MKRREFIKLLGATSGGGVTYSVCLANDRGDFG
jgi:hypothetical protein